MFGLMRSLRDNNNKNSRKRHRRTHNKMLGLVQTKLPNTQDDTRMWSVRQRKYVVKYAEWNSCPTVYYRINRFFPSVSQPIDPNTMLATWRENLELFTCGHMFGSLCSPSCGLDDERVNGENLTDRGFWGWCYIIFMNGASGFCVGFGNRCGKHNSCAFCSRVLYMINSLYWLHDTTCLQ